MAHLACVAHSRRVLVLDDGTTLHRENGSQCTSPRLKLRDRIFTAADVLTYAGKSTPKVRDRTRTRRKTPAR